jgi:FKBP-type peptidyl-prolyl cis-trans isomerase FkpA
MTASFLLVGLLGIVGYHQTNGYTPTLPFSSMRATGLRRISQSTTTLSQSLSSSDPVSRRNVLTGIAASSLTLAFPLTAAANGEEGFTTDPRGFSYKIISPGTSEEGPTARGQKATISYTMSLDGFVLDGKTSNPVGRTVESTAGLLGDKPVTFPIGVGNVFKGWDYAVKGMKIGERRLVILSPELGFGKASMKATIGGVDIPSKSTLYFDITLKEIGPVPVLTEEQQRWLEENPE